MRAAGKVVPLFVADDAIARIGFAPPSRRAFLADCLTGLDEALLARGGQLVVRTGEAVREVVRVAAQVGADGVHVATGVSAYAQRRETRLRAALTADGRRLTVHDAAVTALAPGEVTPQSRDHFAGFTPYFRRRPAAHAASRPRYIEEAT